MSKPKDILTPDEIKVFSETIFLIQGHPYLFVMGFGWAIVGFYIQHDDPMTIRVAHANHFNNAKVHYGTIATEGVPSDCEWRYEGIETLNRAAIQRTTNYGGTVPRGPIRTV